MAPRWGRTESISKRDWVWIRGFAPDVPCHSPFSWVDTVYVRRSSSFPLLQTDRYKTPRVSGRREDSVVVRVECYCKCTGHRCLSTLPSKGWDIRVSFVGHLHRSEGVGVVVVEVCRVPEVFAEGDLGLVPFTFVLCSFCPIHTGLTGGSLTSAAKDVEV